MDNELKRNGSGYYDDTAYRAIKNVMGGKQMDMSRGEIWEVEMNNGVVREVFIIKPFEEYAVGLILRDTPSSSSIMIKSRAAMYADTRRMTYAYYDKIGNYIKTLPEDDVQYIIAEVVKTLDLGTGNEGINLLAAPKCEPAPDSGPAIIRLEAERDIYKGLYESLLEKAVKPA